MAVDAMSRRLLQPARFVVPRVHVADWLGLHALHRRLHVHPVTAMLILIYFTIA